MIATGTFLCLNKQNVDWNGYDKRTIFATKRSHSIKQFDPEWTIRILQVIDEE